LATEKNDNQNQFYSSGQSDQDEAIQRHDHQIVLSKALSPVTLDLKICTHGESIAANKAV